MKKLALVALVMLAFATTAHAQVTMGGPGFRSLGSSVSGVLANSNVGFTVSPTLGIRQWVSEAFGFDLGIGFTSVSAEGGTPSVESDEASGFAFDVGIPFAVKKWERVTFIVRPGLGYGSATVKDKLALTPPNEVETKLMSLSGELEVEWMIADRLSISAAHGIAYRSFKMEDNDTPAMQAEVTGFETTGDNFTSLGFHVYLW